MNLCVYFYNKSHWTMEVQKHRNYVLQQSQSEKRWSLEDFQNFIKSKYPELIAKKYFTQLGLISDYAQLLCLFSLQTLSHERPFLKFSLRKQQPDQEIHALLIKFHANNFEFSSKILLIQMDQIIKVDVRSFDSQTNKFLTLDTFWFNHSSFLNKKISNTYKIISLKEMDSNATKLRTQLNHLLIGRTLQAFARQIPDIPVKISKHSQGEEAQIQSQNLKMIKHFDNLRFFNPSKFALIGSQFYEALGPSENLLKILSFLSIKQILAMKQVSRFMKIYVFSSQKALFKSVYEYNYGKTGFDIDEIDWRKLLNKKRGEKHKKKNANPLMINQGIFRTH